MIRRRDNGLWDVQGGGVEPGEEVSAAARRELREETGLEAGELLQLLGVFSGPDTLHTYPDGNVVAWVTVLYTCRDWQGTPAPADDARELAWFSPAAFSSTGSSTGTMPQLLSAATRAYLKLLAPLS